VFGVWISAIFVRSGGTLYLPASTTSLVVYLEDSSSRLISSGVQAQLITSFAFSQNGTTTPNLRICPSLSIAFSPNSSAVACPSPTNVTWICPGEKLTDLVDGTVYALAPGASILTYANIPHSTFYCMDYSALRVYSNKGVYAASKALVYSSGPNSVCSNLTASLPPHNCPSLATGVCLEAGLLSFLCN
jgi:hypothetical protein